MKLALRLGVCALALAAVLLLPVVLEARGYFEPPRDRAAFEERLAVARQYIDSAGERFFTANRKVRRTMAESIETLEKKHPQVVRAHREEIEAIYDAWLESVEEFSTSASAHWFADHYSAEDIRAHFERNEPWGPATLRRFVVFLVHRGELKAIRDRTELVMYCRLAEDVIPALARLGAEAESALEDLRSSCRKGAEQGLLDPAGFAH